MIFPLNPSENYVPLNTIVFDCETSNDLKTILDIGFTTSLIYPEIRIVDSETFINFLLSQSDFTTCYAHNGGRFDFVLLLDALTKEHRITNIRIFLSGSSSFCWIFEHHKHKTITLIDSYFLLKSSLKTLTENYPTKHKKLDLANALPENLKKTDPVTYLKYLKNDVLSLYDVLQFFSFKIFNEWKIGKLPISAPSLGLKVFRRHLNRRIYTPKSPKLIAFERESLAGGTVFCENGTYEKVSIFDVNSLYPTAMTRFKYPVSERGYWVEKRTPKAIGLYRIGEISSNLTIMKAKAPNSIISGELVDFYRQFFKVEIIEGYEYLESDFIFSYMFKLYEKRKEPGGELYKLLMNSTYGKFIENEEGSELLLATKENVNNLLSSQTPFLDYGNFILIKTKRKVPHRFCGIGSLILSRAKLIYSEFLQGLTNEDVFYGDTDSIHVRHDSPSFHQLLSKTGKGLGQLKLETPIPFKGHYLGKKLYCQEFPDGTNKTKAKGFRGVQISDFLVALKDGKVEIKNERFSSLKEGIIANSCQIIESIKTLKPT